MKPKTVDKVMGWTLLLIMGLLLGAVIGGTLGYKQGQVDALTRKIKYELITRSDSTRVWKWIDVN